MVQKKQIKEMEEKLEEKLNEEVVFEETKEPQVKKSPEEVKEIIEKMDAIFTEETEKEEKGEKKETSIADIELPDNIFESINMDELREPTAYTTELLENIQKIEGTLTPEQFESLVNYVKGSERPEFVETILTQTNDKLTEMLKVMVVLELLRLPALYDYLNALHKNMLDTSAIKNMTYEDISKEAVNIQKEISEILNLSIKVVTNVSSMNQVPTKVEKLANALLGVSEQTRQRIEEIIASDMK